MFLLSCLVVIPNNPKVVMLRLSGKFQAVKPSIFPVLSFISTIPPSSYIKYIIAFQLNLQIMALTLAPFKLCRPQLTTSSQQHFGLGIIHQHITSFQFLPVNEHSKNRCSLQEKKGTQILIISPLQQPVSSRQPLLKNQPSSETMLRYHQRKPDQRPPWDLQSLQSDCIPGCSTLTWMKLDRVINSTNFNLTYITLDSNQLL